MKKDLHSNHLNSDTAVGQNFLLEIGLFTAGQ